MAKFAYNNTKNTSNGYVPCELNCDYLPHTSYKEDVDLHSQLKYLDELLSKIKELMALYRENF